MAVCALVVHSDRFLTTFQQPPGGYYQPYPQQQQQPAPYYPPQQQGYAPTPPPPQNPQPPPPAPCLDSSGQSGPQRLVQDQRIIAFHKAYYVVMQGDGSVGVYSSQGASVWNSSAHRWAGATPNLVPPYSLQLQTDGNLTVMTGANQLLWASDTPGRSPAAPYRLIMGDDGALHLLDSANQPYWSSTAAPAPHAAAPPPQQVPYAAAPPPQLPPVAAPSGQVVGAMLDSGGLRAPPMLSQDGRLVAGAFVLVLQNDGNLVLYENNTAHWSTGAPKKKNRTPPYRLLLQADGNLCVFDAANATMWHTQTTGRGTPPFALAVSGNGQVALTDQTGWCTWRVSPGRQPEYPERPKLRNILCSAGTRGPAALEENQTLSSASGNCELVMQSSGELVIVQRSDGRQLWSSRSSGKGKAPRRLVLLPDGNLVVQDASKSIQWKSNSGGKPEQGPFALLLQDCTAIEIFDGTNTPWWSSGNGMSGYTQLAPPLLTPGYSASGGGPLAPTSAPPKHGLEGILSSVASFIEKPNAGNLVNIVAAGSGGKLSTEKIITGMKEALRVGIDITIKIVGKVNGFLLNMAIKILMPPKLADIAEILRKFFADEVREFEVSMNRAAEKASATAIDIFVQAIMNMGFDDVMGIFKGHDTAITEWFVKACRSLLYASFFPIVRAAMDEFSVTRIYKDVMSKYNKLPLVKHVDVNIEEWVVTKALDGLFHVLGEQETAIRRNPAARITSILQEVFAGFENNRP